VDVLDLLLRLVEKSLVVTEPGDDGANRYRLLETLREHARERLAASGQFESLHGRHAAYYLELVEKAGTEHDGDWQRFWYARLQRELNNVKAALHWAIQCGDVEHALRVCGWLGAHLYLGGQAGESRRWLAELLTTPVAARPTVGRGRALLSGGRLAWNQLDLAQAEALLGEALTILCACADQPGIVWGLELRARVAIARGDYASGRAIAEEAQAIGKATGDPDLVEDTLQALGQACFYLGDYPAARTCFEQELAAGGSIEQPFQAPKLDWLGHTATASGDYPAARAWFAASMRQRLAIDRKLGIAFTLSGLAGLAAAQGQLVRAALLSGAASRLCELCGVPATRTQEGYIRGRLPGIRETLGTAAFDAAWAEGQAMTLEQAIAYALGGDRDVAPT
jgi:non-specific serine/threonine protein kinase